MRKEFLYIVLMVLAFVWTGCKSDDQNEPTNNSAVSLSICLPVDETSMMHRAGAPRRVMGDPGSYEKFSLPKYIYLFIAYKDGVNWKVWDQITIDDAEENWVKQYYSGSMMGNGDSIYRYTKKIIKPLAAGDKFEGRIYAIASAKALTFDATLTNSSSTLNDLLALRFSTSSSIIQQNLQHIYSTPYNYEMDDQYYGSFSSIDRNVPSISLMLYHVAAKVDITWSVADSARVKAEGITPIRLTTMDACNLFNGDAYCFKPMENSMAAPLTPSAGEGDTLHIITPSDEGLWWEGRSYFYTIPYTTTGKAGYFPLQMRMATNGTATYCRPTIYLQVNTSSPFVPWLRATFNVKQPMTASTPEYTKDY